MDDGLEDIQEPAPPPTPPAASQILHGPPILPQHRILLYSADDWEEFVGEWAYYSLKSRYVQVQRFGGARDKGVDVAGFSDGDRLLGQWDNYQCKHYDHALEPGEIWPEIAKVLWYSFSGAYTAPRSYYFVAPWGVGTTVAGYLNNAPQLGEQLRAVWQTSCRTKITRTQPVDLDGAFLDYVRAFDFRVFKAKTGLELIAEHRHSPFHVARFGGGMPPRPAVAAPPATIDPVESQYISKLLLAYADHKKKPGLDIDALRSWPPLAAHFKRQREAFYHAEALRIFARDTVPPGTFESLQDDIFTGVIDVHNDPHPDGYARVCEVTKAARQLQLTENALLSVARPRDRDGVCHQLANDDRLRWTTEQ